MRLDINLASQPYEDARQFWMRWGTAVGALALLTLLLLALDIAGWINARRDRAAIAEKNAMIANRDELRTNAEKILSLPKKSQKVPELAKKPEQARSVTVSERTDRAKGVFVDAGAGKPGEGDAGAGALGSDYSPTR